MNSTMEKFRKSVNICRSYGQKYRGPFFDSQCRFIDSSLYLAINDENAFAVTIMVVSIIQDGPKSDTPGI